jgi:hypothetical protein
MKKLFIFDANQVKWIIQDNPFTLGSFDKVWAHVHGDNIPNSGYVGATVVDVIRSLNEDGYMDGDGYVFPEDKK